METKGNGIPQLVLTSVYAVEPESKPPVLRQSRAVKRPSDIGTICEQCDHNTQSNGHKAKCLGLGYAAQQAFREAKLATS